MSKQLTIGTVYQRWASVVVISGVGVVTGVVHIDHLLEDIHRMPVVSGILFPLYLSVALLCAGYWLGQSDYSGEQTVGIALWSIAGAVVLTLSGTVVLVADILAHQHAVPVADGSSGTMILFSSITEGTAIGFVYGMYATWSDR